jgi:hypothetical protein
MKIIKHLLVPASALAFSLFAFGTQQAQAQPKLQIGGGGTYDWGIVSDVSKPLVAKIELKNVGTQELLINEVKPSCGCTAAMPEKSKLAPGEATVVNVSLNIGSNNGQLMKSINVSSNSQAEPAQTIVLKAFIQRPLQAEPSFVALPQMFVGREGTGSVQITNNVKKAIVVKDLKITNGAAIDVKLPLTIPAGGKVDLTLRATPKVEGYYNAEAIFFTDHPDQQTFEVRMYGNVRTIAPAESPAFAPNANGGK